MLGLCNPVLQPLGDDVGAELGRLERLAHLSLNFASPGGVWAGRRFGAAQEEDGLRRGSMMLYIALVTATIDAVLKALDANASLGLVVMRRNKIGFATQTKLRERYRLSGRLQI